MAARRSWYTVGAPKLGAPSSPRSHHGPTADEQPFITSVHRWASGQTVAVHHRAAPHRTVARKPPNDR
ncbi:hypothetical protein ACLOJK_004445, partial [Asimina triloba]